MNNKFNILTNKMNSVLKFSPKWLQMTFVPITLENNANISKNITLEINNKNSKGILYNKIDINSITMIFPLYKKPAATKITKINRQKRLLDYNLLDDRKYYFTPHDFDNFLNDETFNIDLCDINSPLFKNIELNYEIQNKTRNEIHNEKTYCGNYIENASYNKFTNRLEDYYLYINHVDQYTIDNEDYCDNYKYENYSDSSDEEFDLN